MKALTTLNGPIARSTIATSGVMGLRLLIQAGTLVVLARTLGPTDFGSYIALGALAVLMGTLSGFGTHMTLLRDVTRTPDLQAESLRTTLGTTSLCGVLLLALYVSLCGFWLHATEGGWTVILCLGTAELLLQPIFKAASVERHADGEVVYAQILLLLPLSLRLAVALLVGWLAPHDPLTMFVVGYMLSTAAALAIGVIQAKRRWPPPWRWRLLEGRRKWLEAAAYAFQSASSSGVTELDKILSARLLTSSTAGIYAAASRTINALVLPVAAMMASALPRLFREALRDSGRLVRWLFACAGTYGVAAGLGIWLAAPYVQDLFGPRYDGVEELIRWLAWVAPATSLRTAATSVLTSSDHVWQRAGLEVLGWVVIVFLAAALTPDMHSRGLAVSVITAEWLMACTAWWMVWRLSRIER